MTIERVSVLACKTKDSGSVSRFSDRQRRTGQEGGGKLGCVVILLLVASVLYASYLVIPIYTGKMHFEETLEKIARQAGVGRLDDRVILEQVIRAAKYRGFKVQSEQIRIIRSTPFAATPELKIEVKYQKVVKFFWLRTRF